MEAGAQPPSFPHNQTISSRFEELILDGQVAPLLPIDEATLPHEINSTLARNNLQWGDLGGTLQRLLLWESGFVVANRSQLVHVYAECGRTMDEIVVSRSDFDAAGCPTRSCDGILTSAGGCSTAEFNAVVACAVDTDRQLDRHHTRWSDESPNTDIPYPTVYRTSNSSFSIHMQDHPGAEMSESCPKRLRVVIPCTQFDHDVKWCVPKPGGAGNRMLDRLQSAMGRGTTDAPRTSLIPLVWLAAVFVLAVAVVVFIISRRKVKKMELTVDTVMNMKQRMNETMMTTASDHEPNFIYIDTKDSAVIMPPMESAVVSRTPSLISSSESNASSSYTDLINASEVLIAFQNDPLIVNKRVPMVDVDISRRLCNGGSGEVFLGQIRGQRVAIKQLLRMKRNELADLENFAKEIQLTAALDHPNIIRMVGVAWNTFQNMTLLLEYRSGGDLLNALRKKGARWTWNAEKLRVAMGVAKAMVYLHSRAHPLVHGDIKSRNILIDHVTIEPTLCDFGSSRNESTLDLLSTDPAGTILWSAPEVINAQEYSVKADIYSFGVVLAELDTCTLPYTEERESDGRPIQAIRIAHMVVENQIKPQLTTHCPRFIREIVMACVRHKPHRRPTADAILAKLEEAELDCAALWKSRAQSASV